MQRVYLCNLCVYIYTYIHILYISESQAPVPFHSASQHSEVQEGSALNHLPAFILANGGFSGIVFPSFRGVVPGWCDITSNRAQPSLKSGGGGGGEGPGRRSEKNQIPACWFQNNVEVLPQQ